MNSASGHISNKKSYNNPARGDIIIVPWNNNKPQTPERGDIKDHQKELPALAQRDYKFLLIGPSGLHLPVRVHADSNPDERSFWLVADEKIKRWEYKYCS